MKHYPRITQQQTTNQHNTSHHPVTISFDNNNPVKNDIKPFYCQKFKTQYDNQSVITNTPVDLTQPNDTGWKEELAFLIKNNNSKLLATVDEKNKTLQAAISNDINSNFKDFQGTFFKVVNNMIASQMEILNINVEKNI